MSAKDHVVDNVANKGSDEKALDAVSADSAGVATADAETQAVKQVKKSKFTWFFLLLLVALIGGLQFTGQLQPLYTSLQTQLMEQFTDQTTEQSTDQATDQATDQTTAQTTDHQQTQASVAHPQTSVVQPNAAVLNNTNIQTSKRSPQAPVVEPPAAMISMPEVTSEEVSALLSVIAQLRMEMQQLQASQHSLQDGLLEQQQMNRQVRLRWIADPASRLLQIQLAWEEISLLPGLTDQQRQQAVNMHALARANVQRLQQWQGALMKWTDALATPLHANVLPKPEQAWLAWIVDQFQLRQAPTQEAKRLSDLRSRLLDVARQLSLEAWPNQGAWQRLHAELLLQIEAMQHAPDEASGDGTIDTGLPADFVAIQIDITTLRQTAINWLHDGSQGAAL